jgi:hypothetical protein
LKKVFLVLSMIYSYNLLAQADNLDGMCSKIVKDVKYNYCLQTGSQTAIHLFNILPKIRDYAYAGDAAYNAPSNSNTIFYPTYQNSEQAYELKQYIKADKDHGEMIVTITDLDLADVLGKEKLNEFKETMRKQYATQGRNLSEAIEKMPYESNRVRLIEFIKTQYNVAKKLNLDYIPSEGAGMIPIILDNFENAFIHYQDSEKTAGFSASYADRYLFSITVKNVDKYKSCTTAMTYLSSYLSGVKLGSLDKNIYFK